MSEWFEINSSITENGEDVPRNVLYNIYDVVADQKKVLFAPPPGRVPTLEALIQGWVYTDLPDDFDIKESCGVGDSVFTHLQRHPKITPFTECVGEQGEFVTAVPHYTPQKKTFLLLHQCALLLSASENGPPYAFISTNCISLQTSYVDNKILLRPSSKSEGEETEKVTAKSIICICLLLPDGCFKTVDASSLALRFLCKDDFTGWESRLHRVVRDEEEICF